LAALIDELKRRAHELGFAAAGVTAAELPAETGHRLQAFVGEGRHGTMTWMEETLARRMHPRALWPEARSAIVLAMNYGPDMDPLSRPARRAAGVISVYALHRDYHDVVKGKLKHLAQWLSQTSGAEVKVFVDTAPLMEKPLAQAAGLGWQGKHSNLVSRQAGSWLFLGVILTTAELTADQPETDHCGACHACLDICPTAAITAPYRLDARRCISYLTIEHKGPIAPALRRAIGNRIYGCDDCLAVCPWNKFASEAAEAKLKARDDLRAPALADLAGLDERAFRALFSGSPVKRVGRDRFVSNVLIAIGNSGDAALADVARAGLEDRAPLVRAMAVWALAQLLPAAALAELRRTRARSETDPGVMAEWHGS
jgi:epoxyqueuosine reductase